MDISIKLNEQKQIKKISFGSDLVLTTGELFDVATSFLGLTAVSILKQTSNKPNYTEEQSKKDRAQLYDALVVFISGLAETIYPESQELKGDPEDFLAYLDGKIAELKELNKNNMEEA